MLDDGDGAGDAELGESIPIAPPPFDHPEGNWEFDIWLFPGDGECDGEFGVEATTRPALRCSGRGTLVGCGETMLRDHRLDLVVVEVDDEIAAVLDARENVLGNDDGGALSVPAIYDFI